MIHSGSDLLLGILQIIGFHSCEGAKYNKLQKEIDEGAKDHKVMETCLQSATFIAPPMWNPVDKPEKVTKEGYSQQEHQFKLVVLNSIKMLDERFVVYPFKLRPFWKIPDKSAITYVVLVPHDVQECIHWQIEISTSKA